MKIQGQRRQAREHSISILYQVELRDRSELENICKYEFDILADIIKKVEKNRYTRQKLQDNIEEFSMEVVNGTLENLAFIDEIIKHFSENWEFDRIVVIDKTILRYAIFELLFMDDIPERVTINEAIDLAKKYSTENSSKFINGILDKVLAEKDRIMAPEDIED